MWPPPARGVGPAALSPGAPPDDGSLVWMPVMGVSQEPGQSVGAQAAAAEPQWAHTLQAAPPLPPMTLGGLPQWDGLLPDLPPLPLVPGDTAAAAAAAAAPGCPADCRPAKRVDKKAIARERNRLAQQRFRQKERAKMAEVEEEAEALQRQLDQLRLANQQLQLEQALLEKLLAVRNAIASVVIQLDGLPLHAEPRFGDQQRQQQPRPQQVQQAQQRRDATGIAVDAVQAAGLSAAALLQDPAALQAASQQLAAALGELPSLDQVEQMVGQAGADGSLGPAGRQARGTATGVCSSGGGSGAGGSAPVDSSSSSMAAEGGGAPAAALPPISAAAEAAAASGLEIDKSRLQEVAPPPCPTAQQTVESIEHVESLLEEWRQWREQLRELFQEAQAKGFQDQEQVDGLAAHMRSFVEVFWAACHMRPQLFNLFLVRSLPPPSLDWSGEWARIAQESLPLLSDDDVAVFRRAMQRYSKRVAIAAVGVRPWVNRLQAVVAAHCGSVGSMAVMAAQHAQVAEVASRLHHACTEHYLAYMGLLSEVSAHASVVLRALWHSSSDPFAPDHPAIVSQILRLHQQQQQQLAAAPPVPAAAQGQAGAAHAGSPES